MHYNYMGYWPSVRSRWLDIGMRPIFNHLDQTSLVNKGFITGIWDKTPQNDLWSCGTKREIPSGQYSSILPTHQASHIISFLTVKLIWCPPTNYKEAYYVTSSVSGKDEPNHALRLATWEGKMELPARDFSLGPTRSKIIFWCFKSWI